MNITREVIDRPIERRESKGISSDELKHSLGILSYKRVIDIFIKEAKNLNNIIGHNLAVRTQCLITNYSISTTEFGKLYNKTVYTCDIDFPNFINAQTIKENINAILKVAKLTPIYAFSISHIEKPDGEFINLGLSMIDIHDHLSSTFGVVNFSNNTPESNPIFKEIVYGNCYNPKFYTNIEAKTLNRVGESRNGLIQDYIDKNTSIFCNPIDKQTIDTYINNERQTQLYIDNKTIETPKLMLDIFSKILFISIENLEFIYDSKQKSPLNIKKISFFTKFNKQYTEYCLSEIETLINECMSKFKFNIKKDFYCIYTINEHICSSELFFEDNKSLKIKIPIEKLYCEYSLDNEMMMNCIEYNKENAKEYYLESTIRDHGALGLSAPSQESLLAMDRMIEDYARRQELNLLSRDAERLALFDNTKVWEESE